MESDYLRSPAWSEPVETSVYGRSVLVWRQRPHRIVELLDLAAVSPDQDLLVQGDRRISFAEFVRAIDVGATSLEAHGVGPGDRVLLVLYNSAEFLLAQWATWRLGAVPVLGNRWWSEREFSQVAQRMRPNLYITDREIPEGSVQAPVVRPSHVAEWWSAPSVDLGVKEEQSEDEVALILFTAGSTGVPKSVQWSHRNLLATQQTLHVMRGSRPPRPTTASEQSVALMTTPLFHSGGVTAGITALLDGNRIVLPKGRFDPGEVLELIARERVTSWNAVPTMYQRVLDHPAFAEYDLSSLTAPSTGGAMVPPRLLEAAGRRFPGASSGMGVGWGMTEAAFLTLATGAQIAVRPGTVGRAIPNVSIGVHEPDEGGEGELVARSAAIMVGYFGADDQPIDDEGWYHTGDLGFIDDDGFVYVTGRIKDIVIRGGENVSCPHVEQALAEHPGVLEVSVLGIPHADYGEVVAAVVVARRDGLDEGDLAAFARERLAHFEVPTRWLFLEGQLPTLPTGKVDRPGLRQRLVAET